MWGCELNGGELNTLSFQIIFRRSDPPQTHLQQVNVDVLRERHCSPCFVISQVGADSSGRLTQIQLAQLGNICSYRPSSFGATDSVL